MHCTQVCDSTSHTLPSVLVAHCALVMHSPGGASIATIPEFRQSGSSGWSSQYAGLSCLPQPSASAAAIKPRTIISSTISSFARPHHSLSLAAQNRPVQPTYAPPRVARATGAPDLDAPLCHSQIAPPIVAPTPTVPTPIPTGVESG